MDFAITIEKVCKSFGESTVLSDINIGFEKGKIHYPPEQKSAPSQT